MTVVCTYQVLGAAWVCSYCMHSSENWKYCLL